MRLKNNKKSGTTSAEEEQEQLAQNNSVLDPTYHHDDHHSRNNAMRKHDGEHNLNIKNHQCNQEKGSPSFLSSFKRLSRQSLASWRMSKPPEDSDKARRRRKQDRPPMVIILKNDPASLPDDYGDDEIESLASEDPDDLIIDVSLWLHY